MSKKEQEQPGTMAPMEDDGQQLAPKAEGQDNGQKPLTILEKIKENVNEDDIAPAGSLTLRKILGGDILSADFVRRQVWLIVIIVLFISFAVAFRYQCQQDMIAIDKLENELQDAKYKALTSSSDLTERCRESHILDALRDKKDSVLKIPAKPPYIINVPEE